jgi:methylated-DNA-[protein]-cysteine S-methyltransferase
MTTLLSRAISSPIGKLYLVTRDDVVLGLNLSGIDEIVATLDADLQKLKITKEVRPSLATLALSDYFDGDLQAINSIKVRQSGGDFSQAAWSGMRKIKAGKTESYAQLAQRAGSPAAVRAAGSACAKNKIVIIVACHRIVNSNGSMGAYGPGPEKKLWLLRHEGALP